MTKFINTIKGYEYTTEDGKVSIRRGQARKKVSNIGFCTLEKYRTVTNWTVYGLKPNHLYTFDHLADAKKFVNEELERV